jgi:hypothetical protein
LILNVAKCLIIVKGNPVKEASYCFPSVRFFLLRIFLVTTGTETKDFGIFIQRVPCLGSNETIAACTKELEMVLITATCDEASWVGRAASVLTDGFFENPASEGTFLLANPYKIPKDSF